MDFLNIEHNTVKILLLNYGLKLGSDGWLNSKKTCLLQRLYNFTDLSLSMVVDLHTSQFVSDHTKTYSLRERRVYTKLR